MQQQRSRNEQDLRLVRRCIWIATVLTVCLLTPAIVAETSKNEELTSGGLSSEVETVYREAERAGNLEKARVLLEDALTQSRQQPESSPLVQERQSKLLVRLGNLATRQRRFGEAKTYFSEALHLARVAKKKHAEGEALLALGNLNVLQRRFDEAQSHFEAASHLGRENELKSLKGQALLWSAGARWQAGEYEEALESAARLLEYAEMHDLHQLGVEALWVRVLANSGLNKPERVEQASRQMMLRAEEHGLRESEAQARMAFAWTLLTPPGSHEPGSLGRRLEEALEECLKAGRIATVLNAPRLSALAAQCEGGAYMRLQRYEEALARFKRALDTARTFKEPTLETPLLLTMGSALLKLKRFEDALRVFEEAGTALAELAPALTRSLVGYGKAAAKTGLSEVGQAVRVLEKTVAEFEDQYELLADRQSREAFGSYAPLSLRISLVTILASSGHVSAAFHHAEMARSREFQRRWHLRAGQALLEPEEVEDHLQQLTDQILNNTTLVTYFVAQSKVYAWVANRGEAYMATLRIKPVDLRAKIDNLKNHLGRREDVEPLLAELHEILWRPLAPKVTGSRVFLVPHGPLHDLPFAALPGSQPGRFLAEEKILIRVPFAKAALGIPSRTLSPSARALVLAGSNLPQAAPEVREVAVLYGASPRIGPEATEAEVRRRVGEVDLLHIAAHGRSRSDRPRLSYVELAEGDGHDGQLTFEEIRELDLRELDLTVLSVCESSAGEPTGGDEIQSLARAFLSGGNGAVVTAAWSIQDEASRALMQRFHRHLRAGTEVAEALALAQRYMLHHDQDPEWRHPYYWAAFQVHDAG